MEKNGIKQKCELLIIGGSAGSLNVLIEILPMLKTAPSFPIILALHRKSAQNVTLVELLSTKTQLQVKEAEDKEAIEKSIIYIAPPDYHLLIEMTKQFSLDYSEKVNFSRPSIDVTFESAARVYGPSLTCIVLSGANNDGTEGARIIKEKGGIVVVQQPETALISFMPESVIKNVEPDYVLNVQGLIEFIHSL